MSLPRTGSRGLIAAAFIFVLGASVTSGAPFAIAVAEARAAGPRCTPATAGPGRLLAPVDAPVALPFSLPAGPYGAGNRGLEYATEAGQAVRAVAAGTVRFAGLIAGERYVSVEHEGALVSSYSYLAAIDPAVVVGATVTRGQHLGATSTRLQLGLRRAGTYLDPAPLIGAGRLRPRLVPPGSVPLTC